MPAIIELSRAAVVTSEIAAVEVSEGGQLIVTLKSGKEIVHSPAPGKAWDEFRRLHRYLT